MSYYYLWMIGLAIALVVNYVILNKVGEDLPYQKWFDLYFIFNKAITAMPSILFGWAGYIYLYDYFNSYEYYEIIYTRELALLSCYFVIILCLLYISGNARKIYAICRAGLLAVNIYQAYFIYSHRATLIGFDIERNVFMRGNTAGMLILGGLLAIDLLTCLSFIHYYKCNRYEMTN